MGNNPVGRVDPDGGWDFDGWFLNEAGERVFTDLDEVVDQASLEAAGLKGTYLGSTSFGDDLAGNFHSYNADGSITNAIQLKDVTVTGSRSISDFTDLVAPSYSGTLGPTFNVPAAVAKLTKDAIHDSRHRCSTFVCNALKSGGLNVQDAVAKNIGPNLQAKNFGKITDLSTYKPMAGDVTVYDGNSTHPSGHMQMYTGNEWMSDWTQGWGSQPSFNAAPNYPLGKGFVPYGRDVPSYTIYRYMGQIHR